MSFGVGGHFLWGLCLGFRGELSTISDKTLATLRGRPHNKDLRGFLAGQHSKRNTGKFLIAAEIDLSVGIRLSVLPAFAYQVSCEAMALGRLRAHDHVESLRYRQLHPEHENYAVNAKRRRQNTGDN